MIYLHRPWQWANNWTALPTTFSPSEGTPFSSGKDRLFPAPGNDIKLYQITFGSWILEKKINPVLAETRTSIKTQWSHYIMIKRVSFFVIILCVSSRDWLHHGIWLLSNSLFPSFSPGLLGLIWEPQRAQRTCLPFRSSHQNIYRE